MYSLLVRCFLFPASKKEATHCRMDYDDLVSVMAKSKREEKNKANRNKVNDNTTAGNFQNFMISS